MVSGQINHVQVGFDSWKDFKVDWLTCIVWFLRRGWSKAGWWEICTQSMMSPSGLCTVCENHCQKWKRHCSRQINVDFFRFFKMSTSFKKSFKIAAFTQMRWNIKDLTLSWHCRTQLIICAQKLAQIVGSKRFRNKGFCPFSIRYYYFARASLYDDRDTYIFFCSSLVEFA